MTAVRYFGMSCPALAVYRGEAVIEMGTKRITAKDRIIEAAWDLFMEQGYEETTLQDIIERSGTSKGAFYHHFRSKEDLLFRLWIYFDREYEGWYEVHGQEGSAIDRVHDYIIYAAEAVENSKYRQFFPALYGHEVMSEGRRYSVDESREYYQIIYTLIRDGVHSGEIKSNRSAEDYAKTIAGLHRGMTYNWLLRQCQYSLTDFVDEVITAYLESIRAPR